MKKRLASLLLLGFSIGLVGCSTTGETGSYLEHPPPPSTYQIDEYVTVKVYDFPEGRCFILHARPTNQVSLSCLPR